MSTVPPNPTARPAATARDGARRVRPAATMAVKRGIAPFSIPVSAEETRCSAKGNMLRGKASQSTPSKAMPGQSERATDPRADGMSPSVMNPMRIRVKVKPLGPTDLSPSAMKRKDAPQISPGPTSRSQSVVVVHSRDEERCFMGPSGDNLRERQPPFPSREIPSYLVPSAGES
jgi:hypothetical protein